MATRQCRRTLRDWALPLPLRTAARPLSVNAKYLKVDPKVNLVPKIRADTHERYAAGAPRPPARREDVLLHHTHSSATNEKMGGKMTESCDFQPNSTPRYPKLGGALVKTRGCTLPPKRPLQLGRSC